MKDARETAHGGGMFCDGDEHSPRCDDDTEMLRSRDAEHAAERERLTNLAEDLKRDLDCEIEVAASLERECDAARAEVERLRAALEAARKAFAAINTNSSVGLGVRRSHGWRRFVATAERTAAPSTPPSPRREQREDDHDHRDPCLIPRGAAGVAMSGGDYLVTVCSECLTASCWHGEFMCQKSQNAGTIEALASRLGKLNLEHPDNYSREKLTKVNGEAPKVVDLDAAVDVLADAIEARDAEHAAEVERLRAALEAARKAFAAINTNSSVGLGVATMAGNAMLAVDAALAPTTQKPEESR